MEKKISALFRGSGFYVSLAVCLAAVAIGGYFLLMDGREAAVEAAAPVYETVTDTMPEPAEEQPASTREENIPVSAPVQVIETAQPAMPEEDIEPVAPAAALAPRTVVAPVSGEVVAAFSVDTLLYDPTLEDWRTHAGVDIAAEEGTEVCAAASGVVTSVQEDAMMGTSVTIEHDGGYKTTYANLASGAAVMAGQRVSAGETIGAVGTTAAAESSRGPHLHFSVSKDGDAVNPDEFLSR